jgi:hypothetical protein
VSIFWLIDTDVFEIRSALGIPSEQEYLNAYVRNSKRHGYVVRSLPFDAKCLEFQPPA